MYLAIVVGHDYLDLEGSLPSSSYFEVYRGGCLFTSQPQDEKSRNLLTLVLCVISNAYDPHFDDTIFDQQIVQYVPSDLIQLGVIKKSCM